MKTSCLLRGTPLFHSLSVTAPSLPPPFFLHFLPPSATFPSSFPPCPSLSLSFPLGRALLYSDTPVSILGSTAKHVTHNLSTAGCKFTFHSSRYAKEEGNLTQTNFYCQQPRSHNSTLLHGECVRLYVHVCMLTNADNQTVKMLPETKMQFTCTVPNTSPFPSFFSSLQSLHHLYLQAVNLIQMLFVRPVHLHLPPPPLLYQPPSALLICATTFIKHD